VPAASCGSSSRETPPAVLLCAAGTNSGLPKLNPALELELDADQVDQWLNALAMDTSAMIKPM
jgi:hypothetical protein